MTNTISLRIIGLSATLPNLEDIGSWLQCKPEAIHFFDEEFRPVPLEVHTLSFGKMGNPYLFEKSLDKRVKDIILRYNDNKQTLIFCSSKKNAEHLATLLSKEHLIPSLKINTDSNARLVVDRIQDHSLKDLVNLGYGYHHAGLPPDDRMIIEQMYLAGFINILCSTSTLAHGINLPAHLVIIKGTNAWRGSAKGYEKLKRSEIIQMLGRAGRPGLDTSGIAIIMTNDEDQVYYSSISSRAEVVESNLLHLLSEGKFACLNKILNTKI